ncbi:MAG TPA: hypothetical protein VMX35_15455 [Acidobacteriota bacterium]|nr:hypothetical protein [Acidobacteriota bacterium]
MFGMTGQRWILPTCFWILAGVLSLTAALLVAPVTGVPDWTISSRANNNADPIHFAAVVNHGVDKLLRKPLDYYSPPYNFPDPNSLRSITTYLSESIMALPIRLIVGDRPLLIAEISRIITVVLAALATVLLLRELSVGRPMALAGGMLGVLLVTYGIYIDRIQSLSNQWLVLAIFFAARICKQKGLVWNSFGLAVSLFLLVHASIYTSVMLVSLVPLMIPLLFTGRGESRFWKNVGILALVTLIAGLLTAASMWPWLTDRWDMGAYSEKEFMEIRRGHPALLGALAFSPPEVTKTIVPLMPPERSDGYYPGHALTLTCLFALALALVSFLARQSRGDCSSPSQKVREASGRLFKAAGAATLVFGSAFLAVFGAWVLGVKLLQISGVAVDFIIWGLLLGWMVKLAAWPHPWRGGATTYSFLGSNVLLAGTVLFLLALGSPVQYFAKGPEIASGIFKTVSWFFSPLGQLRALYRIIPLAGFFLALGLVLKLEKGLRGRPYWLAATVSALVILAGFAGWTGSSFGEAQFRKMPEGYSLLAQSKGKGGLLELPLTEWNSHLAMYRMLWQREHGRPIVAGVNSLAPPWFEHAREVFNSFPSRESIWLLRRWNVGSVLAGSSLLSGKDAPTRDSDLVQVGIRDGMVLFDIKPVEGGAVFDDEELTGTLTWTIPIVDSAELSTQLGDGVTFHKRAVALKAGETLMFRVDSGQRLAAVMIDYGYALAARIPSSLKIFAESGGEWRDITKGRSGTHLRARAADLLLNRKPARLVVQVKPSRATKFRIRGYRDIWHLPELRIYVGEK